MLLLYFKDFFIILPFLICFFFVWSFFIKNNFLSIRLNPNSNDVLKNSKVIKKTHYILVLNWFSSNLIYFLLFFITIKLDFNSFWFNHLKISNFNYSMLLIINFFSIFLIFITKFIKNTNVNYNIDYFFAIINLTIFVPILFLSNTMYTFLFLLELISLIIIYKFSVSRSWFNNHFFNFSRILPKSYLNMLFFQYWANFFSSMLIMFSIFSIIYIFGSSEWIFIGLLNNNFSDNNLQNFFFVYILSSFFIGIFLKIGFSPSHLFKIEIYKGIPFISIFFYTTWYFLSFFLYFVILIYNNLYSFKIFFNLIFYVLILIGLFYSLVLLFDVNLIKSFFAYSTIVNSINFITVLYLIVCN